MALPRNKAVLLAGLGALALASGAVLAQGAPESLLPPGFGQAPQPAAPRPAEPAPASSPQTPGQASPAAAPSLTLDPAILGLSEPAPVVEKLELPDEARRSTAVVGAFAGFGENSFGSADGRFLSVLMRRLDVPIASRWASISLRRALLSRVPTPARVSAPDWIAERAWLLLRMGEADGARMLVQAVDVGNFNAKMYAVAGQTALANADTAGLCPLADGGAIRSKEPIWPMARAICASLSGDTAIADVLMDQARRRTRDARGIDIQLAEKMMGVNGGGARGVNVEWTGVNQLTTWRFGMANALGLVIPADLMGTVGPQVSAWAARSPMLPASERLDAAMVAARLGVFSNAALVDLYGAAGEEAQDLDRDSAAGHLRACYVGDDDAARVAAMRWFWTGEGKQQGQPKDRFAAQILTARAAASIQPASDHAGDAADLIAAMMSAGLDRRAARWAGVVQGMSPEKADPAWAILAVGTPRPVVDLAVDRIDGFATRLADSDPYKAQMLIAALAGLGRLSGPDEIKLATDYKVGFDMNSVWARLITTAAARRQPGTVALLVAVGMQNRNWRGVRPAMFYTMINALRQVGLDGEARMIAAEAMSRL
jgi:hypothetical protein